MTLPALLTIAALSLLALSVYLWRAHRRRARVARNLYSWTEWEQPREWDTYSWQTEVDVKPLDETKA